jgi:hypothetical protein
MPWKWHPNWANSPRADNFGMVPFMATMSNERVMRRHNPLISWLEGIKEGAPTLCWNAPVTMLVFMVSGPNAYSWVKGRCYR